MAGLLLQWYKKMTKDDIIGMAWEAGWDAHHCHFDARIERFAALVANAEREACAKLCEDLERKVGNTPYMPNGYTCADAIRARSQHKERI